MRACVSRITLIALISVLQSGTALFAESTVRSLPTLLIKGTVESLNTAEEGQMLLKVKDRYGFETPIYLDDSVTMAQDGNSITLAELKQGTNVEVEYNFDVNTAKRQGVVVVVTDSSAAPTPPPAPAEPAPAAEAPAPAAEESAPETETAAPQPETEAPAQETEAELAE